MSTEGSGAEQLFYNSCFGLFSHVDRPLEFCVISILKPIKQPPQVYLICDPFSLFFAKECYGGLKYNQVQKSIRHLWRIAPLEDIQREVQPTHGDWGSLLGDEFFYFVSLTLSLKHLPLLGTGY